MNDIDIRTSELFIKVKQALEVANREILRLEESNRILLDKIDLLNKEKLETNKLIAQKDSSLLGIIQANSNIVSALRQEVRDLKK